MVPGLSGGSALINMHYNLAQGVKWKGYPITHLKAPLRMSECLGRCGTFALRRWKKKHLERLAV